MDSLITLERVFSILLIISKNQILGLLIFSSCFLCSTSFNLCFNFYFFSSTLELISSFILFPEVGKFRWLILQFLKTCFQNDEFLYNALCNFMSILCIIFAFCPKHFNHFSWDFSFEPCVIWGFRSHLFVTDVRLSLIFVGHCGTPTLSHVPGALRAGWRCAVWVWGAGRWCRCCMTHTMASVSVSWLWCPWPRPCPFLTSFCWKLCPFPPQGTGSPLGMTWTLLSAALSLGLDGWATGSSVVMPSAGPCSISPLLVFCLLKPVLSVLNMAPEPEWTRFGSRRVQNMGERLSISWVNVSHVWAWPIPSLPVFYSSLPFVMMLMDPLI